MVNTSEMAFDRADFLLQFMDCDCTMPESEYCEADLTDCDQDIQEFQFLLQDAIDRKNNAEISWLKKDIQREKVRKRRIKRMIMTQEESAVS